MSDPGELGLPGLDLGKLLEQAQVMQDELLAAQAAATYHGVSGGGAVKVTMSGTGEFLSVSIRPDAVDPSDVELLEDLVLAALHDVTSQAADGTRDGIGGALGGLLG
jgi:DNA-binding YbaB/EbfC family protein